MLGNEEDFSAALGVRARYWMPRSALRCLDAGAEFLVSPGPDLATVALANREGKLMMAGALTPTEVIQAWKAGSGLAKKTFPCGTAGGSPVSQGFKGAVAANSDGSHPRRPSG